jgi:hypothetical protein
MIRVLLREIETTGSKTLSRLSSLETAALSDDTHLFNAGID